MFPRRVAPYAPWTREEAIEWLKARGKQRGRTPTHMDMIPYHNTMVHLFGSISEAQRAAGFEPNVYKGGAWNPGLSRMAAGGGA